MKRSSDCEKFEGDLLLADWETVGADALRADVCVPGALGQVRPGGIELSTMVVFEVYRLGSALGAHGAGGTGVARCFVLESFVLEWHGLPPAIPALGAMWCELLVEAVTDAPSAEHQRVTWRWKLIERGRPLADGRLRGWLSTPSRKTWAGGDDSRDGAFAHGSIVPSSRPRVTDAGEGWAIRWDGRNARFNSPDAPHVPALALADAVLTVTRLRSPEGQVQVIEMSFEDEADARTGVDLNLAWDPEREVNMFSINQLGRSVATAKVELFGRESLGPLHLRDAAGPADRADREFEAPFHTHKMHTGESPDGAERPEYE
ncbi:hypothetical protein [Agromyces aerolatus]|uniref:hypothetical protein n=1 Tax=Agromyces sp. LY-1074 TaxID=3074080 RepID=UPI002859B9DF|nr:MULTISPECIES: hypothetical protein [unclassified Agromyces]MDR5700107.1 hypothetical protein [Agromyces sp. LY-1074]MDR5706525.1 hypothetical protein [Agromyces sp. LY-1358]